MLKKSKDHINKHNKSKTADMIKKYLLYLFRWQLSTPILAIVIALLNVDNEWVSSAIANLIGGLIFFWVDKFIFKDKYRYDVWQVEENIKCADCGKHCRGYRLVKSEHYNRENSENIEFRCESCSTNKYNDIKNNNVNIL